MRVALGSDHGGFELKQEIIKYLEEKNIEYKDYGCYSTESTDYPIYIQEWEWGYVLLSQIQEVNVRGLTVQLDKGLKTGITVKACLN